MQLGISRGTVKLVASSEYWRQAFEKEKLILSEIFGSAIIQIEHIGSTSVPDLIAKPLIDVAVLIANINHLDPFVGTLMKVGYAERKGRLKGRQKVFAKGPDSCVTHHLHIIEHGEQDWSDKIEFMRLLIEEEEVKLLYGKLKQDLSKLYAGDRKAYSEAKSNFINKHLRRRRENND